MASGSVKQGSPILRGSGMNAAIVAFAVGVWWLQQQAALPASFPPWWWAALSCAAFAWFRPLRPVVAVPVAFALGFAWAAGCAQGRLGERLAPELEGRDLVVSGVVASLPALGERSVRFEFDVEGADGASTGVPKRILLSWYRSGLAAGLDDTPAALADAHAIHPGERWRFTVRLKRPHGSVNPHGFDYEGWLLERGIGASGYVRPRGGQVKLGERNSLSDRIERVREAVRTRFLAVLGDSDTAGILVALVVGDQRAIDAEDWRLFSRTGVTHLMSISGLHVTLISGMVAALVSFGWRRSGSLALRLPARKAAAVAATLAAFTYTLLAGFGVPAQRTFFMVGAVAAAVWAGRMSSPSRVLALALLAVVLVDPWAVLAAGFWLSFCAVGLIFYVTQGWTGRESWLVQWARVQWSMTLLLFSQVSLVGPLANAVAIPVVSAVITPLALLCALLPVDALLRLADGLTVVLMHFLEWCDALPVAVWQQPVPPVWTVVVAMLGVLWLVAPRGIPLRWVGLVLFAPALMTAPERPAQGEAWITTLDVGQGLAVVVRTAEHTLLYDAGPTYGTESDSGERIIVPYLRAVGSLRLDAMVVTHNDSDHSGGALSVWDGVGFEVLHPARADYEGGVLRVNNLSCVLRVTTAHGSLLLTGDIEKAAEGLLVQRDGAALHADVMLAPHHGSRTSSTAAFVAAVRPRWLIVPVGYRNRFGHPRADVVARYDEVGARILRTDLDGAVTVRLAAGSVEAAGERSAHPRYWQASRL